MSAEVVREMHAAVGRNDLGGFVDRCHADAVWEHNPGGGSPEEGTYEGRAEIRRLFERIIEGFESVRPVIVELSETGGGEYRVRGELRCKHVTSEAEIVERFEQELEFRDGLMSKGRMVLGK